MSKDIVRIGLCGLSFCSPNLGCSALAYAFRKLLIDIFKNDNVQLKIVVFSNVDSKDYVVTSEKWVSEELIRYSFKKISSIKLAKAKIEECDVVFDFTEGDSFSDIYGLKRFALTSFFKFVTIKKDGCLVLGPQTYGPFKNKHVKKMAKWLISSADRVYARDRKSAKLVESITGIKAITTTDVAFALPKDQVQIDGCGRPSFGLNVSGLLWTGGYTESNQFGLSVNYREYIKRLIPEIIERGYNVHLIPHVVGDMYPECDSPICKELSEQYEHCILAPDFVSPMQAKGYISNMDVFSGARMHATIGAFSSGVVTLPFAYSPKFEGLYESIGYPYLIDGRKLSTDEAVGLTLKYLDETEKLREAQHQALDKAYQNLGAFSADLRDWLNHSVLAIDND